MKTILLLLALTLPIAAQSPPVEYGSTSELKGVKTIFIYTGADLKLRDNLREKIQKKLPQLTVTDSPEGAEVIVAYVADSETFFAGMKSSGSASTVGNNTTVYGRSRPRYETVEYGSGVVVRHGESGRLRLLMNWKGDKSHFWQKGLASKFTDAFIKAYMKANAGEGLKKD